MKIKLPQFHWVVQPLNSVLTMHHLIQNVDQSICIINTNVYNMWKPLASKSIQFTDLNTLIGLYWVNLTSNDFFMESIILEMWGSQRFPDQLNLDFRKLAANTCPFPRLHFLSSSLAPVTNQKGKYVIT